MMDDDDRTDGQRTTGDGCRATENERYATVDGQRTKDDNRPTTDNNDGRWATDDEQQ